MGRLEWVRLDCDIDDLPEAIAAGYHGSSVWYALARISGQFGLEGVIPAKFANANYLARRLGAPVEAMADGLAAVVDVGIGQWDDGYLVIDMERFTSPSVRIMRERRAQERANRAAETSPVNNCDEPLLTVTNRYHTLRDETLRNSNRTEHDLEIDRTLGGGSPGEVAADEPPPQAATTPAPIPTPKPRKDPLKHVTLDEDTWTFDGITTADREDWRLVAPDVNIDRELVALINHAQSKPSFLNAKRNGRWVCTIKSWMMRAQGFAEKAGSAAPRVLRRTDDPTRDKYGREYSSVAIARELGITVGGQDGF